MTAKQSFEYHCIGFPKYWFSTPLEERTKIVDDFIDRELEHADRVLNVEKTIEESPAMRATFSDARTTHSFRRMTTIPRRLSPVRDDTWPQTIQNWQERNKMMSQKIQEELEKTDLILEKSNRFKEDLTRWMQRMDKNSLERFRQRGGSLNRPPKRFLQESPQTKDQSWGYVRTKQDRTAMDERERKLQLGKLKYEGKLPDKKIIFSLEDHLRKYLGIDSSTSIPHLAITPRAKRRDTPRYVADSTLPTPRRRQGSAKSAKSNPQQRVKSGRVVSTKKVCMSMRRKTPERRAGAPKKTTLLARRRRISSPPPPPPPSMHQMPSLAQRLGLVGLSTSPSRRRKSSSSPRGGWKAKSSRRASPSSEEMWDPESSTCDYTLLPPSEPSQ